MMAIGRKKIQRAGLADRITLRHGDAQHIPFSDRTFDAVTVAFGIRNMEDPPRVLGEMRRVLKAGGRALVLEFSLPENRLVKSIHLFYLRHIVPLVGLAFSGHYKAYQYLDRTIETFPYGGGFCLLMEQAKFQRVRAYPLLFGVATIYQGDKV
jgi:demethylmenaquinone methyltransferase/2-methoxy-6-polyprenyl-1,4-benzoquinol methylase